MNKKIKKLTLIYFLCSLFIYIPIQFAKAQETEKESESFYDEALYAELNEDYENETISDPIEPFNRAMFYFNDKL
jgi:ABC-type transporter lipoprotein component MlaA